MKLCHLNINSLPNKVDHLKYILRNTPFDIITISESHCDENITDSELHIDGFNIIRKDRSRHGGGIVMYIKDSVRFTVVNTFEYQLECLWIRLNVIKKVKPLLICAIYRPPNTTVEFFDKLSDMLHQALDGEEEIILLGDLNCDLLPENLDSSAELLLSTMTCFLMYQLIELPTRIKRILCTHEH